MEKVRTLRLIARTNFETDRDEVGYPPEMLTVLSPQQRNGECKKQKASGSAGAVEKSAGDI
jgi:hypothetical protein